MPQNFSLVSTQIQQFRHEQKLCSGLFLETFLGTLFGQIKPYGNFFRYLMCLAAGTGFAWFPSY